MSDNQSEEQPSPDLAITELGLPAGARNVLLGAGISTVDDVLAALQKGDEALTRLKGFGPKSLTALKQRLRERGFSLPVEAVPPLEALEAVLEKEIRELEALELGMAGAAPPPPGEGGLETPEQAAAPARKVTPQAETMGETLPFGQRLGATLAQPREQFGFGAWIYGMIGLALVLLLLSALLLNRLGITGYTTLDDTNSSISHPDGLTLSVNPESFTDRLRVQVESVPRLEFLEGSAGGALREAVEALPAHLVVRSPLYQIQVRGDSSQPVMIDVVVPNDSEPWETLDIYTWAGEEWKWIGSELHAEVAEHEFIRARVTDVPPSLVVVQAGPITPIVSTPLGPDDNPVDAAANVLDEVNPTGLLLGTNGGFVGGLVLPLTEEVAYTVLPTLRNWAPGATVNRGLLSDVLTMPEIQKAHIANIVELCAERGFAGVDVDYRGVGSDGRDAYSSFISALANALHAQELRLSVVVEPPTPTGGSWDTGGYDWAKLGAAADAIKIPFPEDPAAYVEGGQAQRLLGWATTQVERYKLRMLVSSLSVEQSGEGVKTISLERALAPFGDVVALNDVVQVEPGSQVEFGLVGQLRSIRPLEAAGTYRLEYEADDGETHTVWLGTATSLATKLRWAQDHHLGGVAVADMLDPGNDTGIVDVVATYADQRAAMASPLGTGRETTVVWAVTGAEAMVDHQVSPLTEPGYTWTVLVATGEYTVKATIAGFDHGSVPVVVAKPEPVVTEGITATEEITSTEQISTASVVTEDCLGASYVADVTIPDNTQMDKGKEFVKTWSVRNSGTCDWPEDTVLVRVHSELGGPESVPVGAVAVGETVEISIDLVAPDGDGVFDGQWALRTGDTDIPRGKVTAVIQAGEEAGVGPGPVPPVSDSSFELGGQTHTLAHPNEMHYALMIVYNIDFTLWSEHDPQAGYAIIRPGGNCPACDTLHAVMGSR